MGANGNAVVQTFQGEKITVFMRGAPVLNDATAVDAEAAGLPLIEAWIPQAADNAAYVASFSAALDTARSRWPGLSRIAYGDLLLADVRAWREALCASLGWTPLFPLFGSDTARLARDMIAGGLRANLCCIDTTQLDAGFAGRAFDASLLADLPPAIDPCGENGEFHTCVSDGPMFDRPLQLVEAGRRLADRRFALVDYALAD